MDDLALVAAVALVLGVALLGGLVARRLGQPFLLGYIVASAMIGPHTPGISNERDRVVVLANLGVAFLLFALGLDFSLEELVRVRRIALPASAGRTEIPGRMRPRRVLPSRL